MRNRIFGAIGVVWGGAIVFTQLTKKTSAEGAYAQGLNFALVFGAVLFLAGLYYVIKGGGKESR